LVHPVTARQALPDRRRRRRVAGAPRRLGAVDPAAARSPRTHATWARVAPLLQISSQANLAEGS